MCVSPKVPFSKVLKEFNLNSVLMGYNKICLRNLFFLVGRPYAWYTPHEDQSILVKNSTSQINSNHNIECTTFVQKVQRLALLKTPLGHLFTELPRIHSCRDIKSFSELYRLCFIIDLKNYLELFSNWEIFNGKNEYHLNLNADLLIQTSWNPVT
jgi:hypothetical protein